jgi:hypothetical protein
MAFKKEIVKTYSFFQKKSYKNFQISIHGSSR